MSAASGAAGGTIPQDVLTTEVAARITDVLRLDACRFDTAAGIEEIVETYLGRFAALGPTNHFSHGHVVILDDTDPDRATGLIASHAEVSRNGVAMQVALRYKDTYRRVDGRWRFADRLMSYMYYLPFTELSEGLGDRKSVRAYGDHRPSDWPEVLYAETGNAWLAPYYTSRG